MEKILSFIHTPHCLIEQKSLYYYYLLCELPFEKYFPNPPLLKKNQISKELIQRFHVIQAPSANQNFMFYYVILHEK